MRTDQNRSAPVNLVTDKTNYLDGLVIVNSPGAFTNVWVVNLQVSMRNGEAAIWLKSLGAER